MHHSKATGASSLFGAGSQISVILTATRNHSVAVECQLPECTRSPRFSRRVVENDNGNGAETGTTWEANTGTRVRGRPPQNLVMRPGTQLRPCAPETRPPSSRESPVPSGDWPLRGRLVAAHLPEGDSNCAPSYPLRHTTGSLRRGRLSLPVLTHIQATCWWGHPSGLGRFIFLIAPRMFMSRLQKMPSLSQRLILLKKN